MSSLVAASFWLTLSELAFTFSGYITHAVLGRILGPAEYGRFGLIITFSTMIIVLIGRGVPVAMSKYLGEIISRPDQHREIPLIRNTAAWLQFFLVALLTISYYLLSPFFAAILKDPSLTPLFRLSSLIIPSFALASFYVYYFTGIQRFKFQALMKFIRSGAKILFIVGLGIAGGVPGAVLGQALAPLTVFFTAFWADPFPKRTPSISASLKIKRRLYAKKLLIFAWPIIVFMIFYELMISIDLYLVKALLQNDYQTGIYNAALTVGRIPYYAFYFLTIILLPKTAESVAAGVSEHTQNLLTKAFRFLFMFLAPTVALLSAFAPSAIRFFYGAKYTPAAPAMSILAVGLGFLTVFYILTFTLNGAGKNKIPMRMAIFGAILNAILNYLFISRWEIIGSALATSLTSFFVMAVLVFYAHSRLAAFFQFKAFMKYLFASVFIYWLAVTFFPQGRFIFILWSIILFTFYLLLLSILKEIKKEDWQYLITAIQKKGTRL